MDSKIAAALLDAVTTAALDAALVGKADASALAALLSTVDGLDTPLEVDTKIANAALGLAEAFVAAQPASRDASISALQGAKADATLLASYATNAALSASETTLQSSLDAILAELAALQLPGRGVVNAPAWAGFTTWELVRGSNVVRNLHLEAPLSAALANGDDTLSITADCYSVAAADAALAAALLAYYTSAQVDALLTTERGRRRTPKRPAPSRLRCWPTTPRRKRTPCWPTTARRARRTRRRRQPSRGACWPTGRGQPDHLAGGVADQDTATASSIAAALLSYYTIAQVDGLLAGKLGVTEAASGLETAVRGRRRGRRGGGRHRRADSGPHGRLPGKLVGSSHAAWSWPRTPWAQ